MHQNKYRNALTAVTALVNLCYAVLIAYTIWHHYNVMDKSNWGQQQYHIFQNAEQDHRRLQTDENLLHIVVYNVLPMSALLAGFSGCVLLLSRKRNANRLDG